MGVHCLGARGVRDILPTTLELRRLLASQRPDLVQTFLFHANVLGRVAARLGGVPRVVCGIRVAERHCRWHLGLDRLTAGMVDRYVCVSHAVARFSHVRGGLPNGKLVVIPNGIDLRRYPAPQPADLSRWGIRPGRRTIAFVGRLDRQKGVRWLIETSPRWLDRLPDCELLLVGAGPEEADVRRLSEAMGIAGRVHFAGWQRDVPAILAASHLLVLPSRWEGMPNVVLQALAEPAPGAGDRCRGGPRAARRCRRRPDGPLRPVRGSGRQASPADVRSCYFRRARPNQPAPGGELLSDREDGGGLPGTLAAGRGPEPARRGRALKALNLCGVGIARHNTLACRWAMPTLPADLSTPFAASFLFQKKTFRDLRPTASSELAPSPGPTTSASIRLRVFPQKARLTQLGFWLSLAGCGEYPKRAIAGRAGGARCPTRVGVTESPWRAPSPSDGAGLA